MEIKKILISGASGFIGRSLAQYFREKNKYYIVGMDNLSGSNFEEAKEASEYCHEFHLKDIRRKEKYPKYDYVLHCAGQVSVNNSVINPVNDASNNILGTIALLEKTKGSKFIYFSSGAVYGEAENPDEDTFPFPESPYGFSKLAGEFYTRMFSDNHLILRMANIYSEDMNRKYPTVHERFRKEKEITIYGGGKQTRDFLCVESLCQIVDLLKDKKNDTYNVGTGRETRIIDLAKVYNKPIKFEPARAGELKDNIMNISRLTKEIEDFPIPLI